MFKSLSRLINKFRSESTSIPKTDHPIALPLDSKDGDQKEIEAIERESEVIHLSGKIRILVVSLAESYSDNYPTHIVKRKELIYECHECIINTKDDIFKDAATEAFKDMFRGELRLRGDIVPISRRILRELRDNRMAFDIQKYFIEAYQSFFQNYRPYWEDSISKLKQANAITHRRQYLIEKIDEFSDLLETEGINDFVEILQDYRQFNIAQLDILTNNNSKN